MNLQFEDRRQAGRLLAEALARFSKEEVTVLALPRGGVPVAYEIATALHAPLGVFVVRKLGVPGHRELAMGAIASGGIRVLNEDVVADLAIPPEAIDAVAEEELQELVRREDQYYASRPLPPIRDRTVILVDDGLATGATMRAAVLAVRQQQPARIVVAVPVGARSTCDLLREEADEVTCLRTPEPFSAVGLWYRLFDQTSDEEVRRLLSAESV
ncbi:MAG TPA: phosphoribosyltransferase [Vicinamibacterales bacterium]|nr:phosphoribosyltransferase [Vicinamibacterales bacterium]